MQAERLHYHKPRLGQTSSRQSGKGNSRLQSQHTLQVALSECTQRIPQEAGCVHLQRKEQSSFLSDQSPQGSDVGAETVLPQQAHRRYVSAHRARQHWAETSQNPSFQKKESISQRNEQQRWLCATGVTREGGTESKE